MIHIFRTFRSRSTIPAFPVWFWVLISCFSVAQAQYKMENSATGSSHQSNISKNANYQVQAVIGQTFAGNKFEAATNAVSAGLFSYYIMQPNTPFVEASQGDFADRVNISWKWDVLSPPANTGTIDVYRDGVLLASVPKTQNFYQDFNVYPGKYYYYEVVGQNQFGRSMRGGGAGFINPNGIITGAITTQFGRPVYDVEVGVLPTLGKALRFDNQNMYVDAGNYLNLGYQSFTIEYWLKRPQNAAQNVSVFIQNPDVAANIPQLTIGYASGNQLVFGFTREDFLLFNDTSSLNTWHHYAFVYDIARKKRYIYIDGKQVALGGTAQDQPYRGEMGPLWLGKGLTTNNYSLDEMRVWTAARDSGTINRNMRRTVNTNAEHLAAYWKFDEGIGNLVFDLSPNNHNGRMISMPVTQFIDDRAPVRTSAFTDLNGNYVIEGINYGSSTNFNVTPVRAGRIFSPPTRIVTLSSSNTAANNIDFTDISQVPVSGFVRHFESECYADSIEILIDGQSTIPATFTNAEGKYIVEFEPGTSARIAPRRANYTFSPSFIDYQNVVEPIAGQVIEQTTLFDFSGVVGGGNCLFPIGPVTVILEGITANQVCRTDTIKTGMGGEFRFTGLSPLKYRVYIIPESPVWSDSAKTDTIDLKNGSVTREYRYFAPLKVDVAGLPEINPCLGVPLLEQFTGLYLTYNIYEEYTYNGIVTGRCPVDTAFVEIFDGFGDKINSPYQLKVVGGSIIDTVVTGYPNILGDYKKTFQIVAQHRDGRNASKVYSGIVVGFKPQEGSFVTVSPALPLMILRDPPGDGSYSFLSEETSVKSSLAIYGQTVNSQDFNFKFSLAPDFKTTIGFLFGSTELEVDNTLDFTIDKTMTYSSKLTESLETEFKVSQTFRTDEDQGIVGTEGDVILGAAINFTYALTDVLSYQQDSCLLKKSHSLTFAPTGFSTTYIYTTNYIKNVLIPRLISVDSIDAAENWQDLLEYNDSLKSIAEFERNISFSAGSTAEYQQTTITTSTSLLEFDLTIDSSLTTEVGSTIQGVGVVGGYQIKAGYSLGRSESTVNTTTNTVGYSLRDDDPGDAITVDIYKDLVLGTPVFKTIAGTTSCPWEEETQPRDIPRLLAPSGTVAVNVEPNEPAVFPIIIGNENATETREYYLRVLNETNPNGAVVAVNGIIIEQGINFNIGGGQAAQAILTITRGPQSYDYENIKIILTSPCEFDRYQSVGTLAIYDQLQFTVRFKEPCTQVSISTPAPNWLINTGSGNQMNIIIGNYDRFDPDLRSIQVQYRRMSLDNRPEKNKIQGFENQDERNAYISSVLASMRMTPGEVINYKEFSFNHLLSILDGGTGYVPALQDDPTPWAEIKTIPKDSLGIEYHIVQWEPVGLPDGQYEIRAVASCGPGNTDGVSTLISGIIDRTRPEVLGLPEPVDAVLNADDQIRVTFTEDIACTSIDPLNNIQLINTQTGNPVLFDFTCNGREVLITPQGSYAPYENKILKAVIKRITDVNGNPMSVTLGTSYIDSLGWEFLVDRNPVRWIGGDIDVVKYLDETIDIQRTLQNSGAFNQPFTLTDIPSWLTPTATAGTVQLQSSTTLGFRFPSDISAGIYVDTLYAQTINGNEPLIITLRVLCRPPVWSVNTAAYQHNMNMIAELFIDTARSNDRYDRIAAYSGNELRGIAELQYIQQIDRHLAFITIYSNVTDNENLSFRVWDASECTEYGQIMETFTFKADTVIGGYQSPVKMTATRQILEDYRFNAGWNWFSLNTRSADMNINSVMSSVTAGNNDVIKDQESFSTYFSGHGWVGSISAMNNRTMYMLRLSEKDTLRRVGYAIDSRQDTIRLRQGWTWIGYTPNTDMTINTALASLQATDGDLIKSQQSFSVYAQGIGWIGSLQFLRPRQGYIIRSAQPGNLIYPSVSGQSNNPTPLERIPAEIPDQPLWSINRNDYQFTMNIIAKLTGDYADSLSSDDVIALFAGDECRGMVYPEIIPGRKEMYIFLTAYANQTTGEYLHLKLLQKKTGIVYDLGMGVTFISDGVQGSIGEPLVISPVLSSTDDLRGLPTEYSLDQNYPNPFNPTTVIRYGLPEEAEVILAIYNIMGESVRLLESGRRPAGYHLITWDGRNNSGEYLPSGVYLYTLRAGDKNFTKKIVFLK